MNKIILIIIIVLIIAVGGYFIYYAYQGSAYKTTTPGETNNNTPATNNQQQAQPENLSASVFIKNFAFNPATLTIKAGTTVTWTNNDPFPHQIKSAAFNSSPLDQGSTFQFTFSALGQYDYSCAIHPSMKGKIIITQ